jgi:hypothetical protein
MFSKKTVLVALMGILLNSASHGMVRISELMADNMQGIEDADGSTPDWIELENTGATSVNLEGWGLSDDPEDPGQWIFPSASIAPGQSVIVFATGKDWRISGVELHTNFKLGTSGDSVVLSVPDGAGGWSTEDSILDYPPQVTDVSYGRVSSTPDALGYFETPTPGQANPSTSVSIFAEPPVFSVTRGYFDTPFTLTISGVTTGADIIYTTDGSRPSPGNGTVASAASGTTSVELTINDTSIIRACSSGNGMGTSRVITHTYLFAEKVLQQSASDVPGVYGTWGHSGPDWAMDTKVTNHSNPEDKTVAEDFHKIPTVSIAMKWAELFGAESSTQAAGIYLKDEGIRKEASFEIINPDGFDDDPNRSPSEFSRGQVLVFGGSSTAKRWKTDKLSFRFNFEDKLDSVVFDDTAVGTYDRLVLDARLNNVWNQSQNPEQRQFGDYARDAVLSDLDNSLGRTGVHSQHVHLFLNGLYWGIYTLHERPDDHFAAAYFGGDNEDYDVVKHGSGADNFIVDGYRINPALPISNTNHTAAVNYLDMVARSAQDLSDPTHYAALAEVLDIPALRDHILTNFYGGNYDWPQQNWYATYNRASGQGKWRFHSWDAEHVFKYEDYPRYDNVTNKFEGWDRPDGIHLQLLDNPDYRMAFADAAHRYLFNDGPFSVEKVWALFQARFDDIDEAMRAESARWGDNGPLNGELHLRYSNVPNPNPTNYGQSDTTDFASWYHERERIRTKILGPEPNRATRFLQQLRTAVYGEDHPKGGQANPLYPAIDAPVFSQNGGSVEAGDPITIANPNGSGTVYYTLDGSDPRQPGSGTATFFSGAVSSGAITYTSPVTISATSMLRSRTYNNGTWSALNEAEFVIAGEELVPASADNIALAEIHYHPANPSTTEEAAGFLDDGNFEYFEILNTSTNAVSLANIQMMEGVDMELLADGVQELAPGERALFVSNVEAFNFRYGDGLPIAGIFLNDTALSNGGEQLKMVAADGSPIFDITYDDKDPWPVSPDGDGPSLVFVDRGLRELNNPLDWRASTANGGTPGTASNYQRFSDWIATHVLPSDPDYATKSQASSDPDEDGLSNLEEYLLDSNPLQDDGAMTWLHGSILQVQSGTTTNSHTSITVYFKHPGEGVQFSFETSNDLNTWKNAADSIVLETATIDEAGFQTRTYRVETPLSNESANEFFRIQLTPY